MFGNRDDDGRRTRPPGLGVAIATVPFLILLAGVRYDWWRYPKPAVIILEPATVGFAILGLAIVGFVWIVRSYGYWKRERRLSWTIGLAPLIVMATALVFVLVQTPTDRGFDRAHDEMKALAMSMLADNTQHIGPTEINGLQFSSVYLKEGNCVYFVDSNRSSITRIGWLYTANCNPNPNWFARLERVADNWYAFEQGS